MLGRINSVYPSFKASISDSDIDGLGHAKQHFSDCYLMTTLETLSHTPNGRKILKEQIEYDDNNPKLINCYLYKNNGEKATPFPRLITFILLAGFLCINFLPV